MRIRAEERGDEGAVFEILTAAFPTPAEAELVNALRRRARPLVSLVAEEGREIVAHILFSPVTLSAAPRRRVMGLAPMAVAPARQRQGVGSALVPAGLERCKELGSRAVVVLGHPEYYPRFGFVPARGFGIRCAYDVPDEAFMALELSAGGLRACAGTARYAPEFDSV